MCRDRPRRRPAERPWLDQSGRLGIRAGKAGSRGRRAGTAECRPRQRRASPWLTSSQSGPRKPATLPTPMRIHRFPPSRSGCHPNHHHQRDRAPARRSPRRNQSFSLADCITPFRGPPQFGPPPPPTARDPRQTPPLNAGPPDTAPLGWQPGRHASHPPHVPEQSSRRDRS